MYNPKSFKQIARDIINIDDKQLNKELAKKMSNPYYFTERALSVGFNITLESHGINHANSRIIPKPNYPKFGFDLKFVILLKS